MNKTVLITGASSGFGLETARTLKSAGFHVYAGVRDIQERNRSVAGDLIKVGIVPVELDVTCDDSVNLAVNRILTESGGEIGTVINNAGIAVAGVSESFTSEQVQKVFDVNVLGVHRVLRATLPALRKQKDGLIINIGSILGRVTFPFFGLYGASKYALEALTESYRYELVNLGIDVVLVQPSAYPTNMYSAMLQAENVTVAQEYGAISDIPSTMFKAFSEMFSSDSSPSVCEVAESILSVVTAAKEQRPSRVVVGASYGADLINRAAEPVQEQVLLDLGLDILSRRATSACS